MRIHKIWQNSNNSNSTEIQTPHLFSKLLKISSNYKITNMLVSPVKLCSIRWQMHVLTHPKGREANGNDEETKAVHDEWGSIVVVGLKADVRVQYLIVEMSHISRHTLSVWMINLRTDTHKHMHFMYIHTYKYICMCVPYCLELWPGRLFLSSDF